MTKIANRINADIESALFNGRTSVRAIRMIAAAYPSLSPVYRRTIPRELRSLMNVPMITKADIDACLRKRAINILRGYKNYARPVLDYDRMTIISHDRINLLSAKGKQTLATLESGGAIENLASITTTQKLDLDLFIEPNYDILDDFQIGIGVQAVPVGRNESGQIQFILTNKNRLACVSGCPHGCPHCAEFAQNRIVSMPFPIYLKILSQYHDLPQKFIKMQAELESRGEKNFFISNNSIMAQKYKHVDVEPYDDSDPLLYYDPIIGADFGDLCLRASDMNIHLSCCTRGLLSNGGISELALRKRAASKNPKITLSVPVFASDKKFSAETFKCAYRTLDVLDLYGKLLANAKFIGSEPAFLTYHTEFKNLRPRIDSVSYLPPEARGAAAYLPTIDRRFTHPCNLFVNVLNRMKVLDFGYEYLRGSYTFGGLQLDALGQVSQKNVDTPTEITRMYAPIDIYGIRTPKIR